MPAPKPKPNAPPPPDAWLARRARRRAALAVAGLLALLLLIALDRRGALLYPGDEWARYHDRWFVVDAIVDGDTIDLRAPDGDQPTTRVRLWGVDCPESAKPFTNPPTPADPFADDATALTASLCEGNRVRLTLQRHRLRGVHGRLLAYVHTNEGTVVNEALLDAGLARDTPQYPHDHTQRYRMLALDAQRRHAGLWSEPNTNTNTNSTVE